MDPSSDKSSNGEEPVERPFRKAIVRGMGVAFPPLLTVLIFLWVINMTYRYVLDPVTFVARETILLVIDDTRRDLAKGEDEEISTILLPDGRLYKRIRGEDNVFIPKDVYQTVQENPGEPPPTTAKGYYRRYIALSYLPPYVAIPLFLAVFIVVLYLLGRFMAAGVGRFFWSRFEYGIHRLPLIRNVYSSVKQVSDFLFTEREIEYTRVVAVEYPRKGIWALGLVTGESMLDIRSAANEPVLSVLIPTSPMPMTGFTMTVRRSETVDLNITIDQAFQFIISCGVVVPPQQLQEMLEQPAELPEPADSDRPPEPAASG